VIEDFQKAEFDYVRSPDQARGPGRLPARHAVIVVGAGPVGLAIAIDLARQGVRTVVLDDDFRLSTGSRAICFAKRTLEIFDRLGCGERMVRKGVSWNVGKVFFQDDHVYTFNLLAESGHRRPAFINLQQYYVEGYLVEQAIAERNVELRWRNEVTGVEAIDDGVGLTVRTPDGDYRLQASYLVACDGARSPVRKALGLESHGRTFRDRFLIADVKMKADFPAERWFWFDPPFHRNRSVLLHRQPDNVWRIDFQLGFDADPEVEKRPENVLPRIRALLGPDAQFELEWVSVYTFSCLRMDSFRHGRVLFAGDSAHGVSPFGARGANSGVQDADNLAWKLRLVLEGRAPDRLLDTYAAEREAAADENILHSTRSTDFITPKSDASRVFRDAVLRLAKDHPFARRLVNSGRLSVPSTLAVSPLNTPDSDEFDGLMIPGAAAADAPVRLENGESDWFLARIGGGFTVVCFAGGSVDQLGDRSIESRAALARLAGRPIGVRSVVVLPSVPSGSGLSKSHLPSGSGLSKSHRCDIARPDPEVIDVIEDSDGLLTQRFDARAGTTYLLRPDQHVCARWRQFDAERIEAALVRATCNE
jgi:3-(3-hydroxy-phenyl)propionate hydroxylase